MSRVFPVRLFSFVFGFGFAFVSLFGNGMEADFAARQGLDDIALTELFAWDENKFKDRLAGSAIYRIGHEQWLRNIAVALGNAPGSIEVLTALQARLNEPSLLVREHVKWALARQGQCF